MMKDGFKGPVFRRGHVIREEDIETMLDIGKTRIFIWEENAGEIHEEECALRLAAMTPVDNANYEGPSEGKMVLRAEREGLFRVDTEFLGKINRIGDITITTLPDHYPVKQGMRLASMRIIPLVTKEEQILKAETLCKGKQLYRLKPYQPKKAGVIITGSEIYRGRIRDKFEPVARQKLSAYPCEITAVRICDDELSMITKAAKECLVLGSDLLVFFGGMSVDPDDVTPAAVRELGADIVSYGVPAQPGNMTLMAYLGGIPVIGVPGAAISLPATIFDVLLPAVFAEERITKDDLVRLAEGGLCQLCGDCHFPNCTFGRY